MDLRQQLEQFEAGGGLRRIAVAVDPQLELAALCRREFAGGGGSALLFEKLAGCRFRSCANLFGAEQRVAQILRCADLGQFAAKLQAILAALPGAAADRLRNLGAATLPLGNADPLWQPRPAATLTDLPALRSWPGEISPYLTLPLVSSRHPLTGERNLGLYRVQILNGSQAAVNIPPDSDAGAHLAAALQQQTALPVSLIFGGDPALIWLACAPLPAGCDEYRLFSHLFGEALPLAQGESRELPVPAAAEFVVEGFIQPGRTCAEGPFGNHTGRYVTRADCPLLQITSIAWREGAIMPVTVVGPPPSENIYLAKASEILIRELLRIDFPEITGLLMPELTIFHGAALLQVAGSSRAGVRDLIEELWCASPLKKSKLLVLLDGDIELAEFSQVYWRLINQLDAGRIYQRGKQIAIDATGVDPQFLVREDRATSQLLRRRASQYFRD